MRVRSLHDPVVTYLEESRPRLTAEGIYAKLQIKDQLWDLSLFADHFTQVLHCEHECVRDLATRPGRLSPMENYLPLHYDYLQFAYFKGRFFFSVKNGDCTILSDIICVCVKLSLTAQLWRWIMDPPMNPTPTQTQTCVYTKAPRPQRAADEWIGTPVESHLVSRASTAWLNLMLVLCGARECENI